MLKEIERRARPLKRNPNTGEILYDPIEFARSSSEEEYIELLRQIRSFSGFLGENESLKQRIEEDRKIVFEELKTSHLELAHHLKNVKLFNKIKIYTQKMKNNKVTFQMSFKVCFKYSIRCEPRKVFIFFSTYFIKTSII